METTLSFKKTNNCPICRSSQIEDYFSMPYNSDNIKKYIFSFYRLEKKWTDGEYSKIFDGINYVLSKCHQCGGLFQRNRPNEGMIQLIYNKWMKEHQTATSMFDTYNLKDSQHYISEALRLVHFTSHLVGIKRLSDLHALGPL